MKENQLIFSHFDKLSQRYVYDLSISDSEKFKNTIAQWSKRFTHSLLLDDNNYSNSKTPYHRYDILWGIGNYQLLQPSGEKLKSLQSFLDNTNDWLLGYFSYDLKEETEGICVTNPVRIGFSDLMFFVPQYLFILKDKKWTLLAKNKLVNTFLLDIENVKIDNLIKENSSIAIKERISHQEYLEQLQKIKKDIQLGNVYELTFCQEFYNDNCNINPYDVFIKLTKKSPNPFSAYLKENEKYLLSSSPERYLQKSGKKIVSQPIKGTIKRTGVKEKDILLKKELKESIKEQAENIMIVDLVRNDLSRIALPSSVKLEERCGIYSFSQVFQMISTISSESEAVCTEIIDKTFPMGSMTGAPKHKAIELIERYESFKRELFSGSIGYFTPEKNFDFNVVIRSIMYNEEKKYLSFPTGSAITIGSDIEQEYQECLLKAKAIKEILS
jgi:para-aminobenzoate synthetase component 1